jgi:hypothetical protein
MDAPVYVAHTRSKGEGNGMFSLAGGKYGDAEILILCQFVDSVGKYTFYASVDGKCMVYVENLCFHSKVLIFCKDNE